MRPEMPFAGHPNVGTATVLAWRGEIFGRACGGSVSLEEKAGVVPLDILVDDDGRPAGAMLTAPEPFAIPIPKLPVKAVAESLGLSATDIRVDTHPPLVATAGLPFIIAELTSLDALRRSQGVPSAFAPARAPTGPLCDAPPKILAYVHDGGADAMGALTLRCRMHRADGTEDAGTGSANCALIGLLASLPAGGTVATSGSSVLCANIVQGVEMGRPSALRAEAERRAGGKGTSAVGAVRIGGHCAPVSRGELVGWD